MPVKYVDPDYSTISSTIGNTIIDKDLPVLGAIVNLFSYSVHK